MAPERPVTLRRDELRAAVAAAREAAGAAELAERQARRSRARAMAPLTDYADAVAAGEREADPALEAELREQATRTIGLLRPVARPGGGGGVDYWADPVAEATLAGSRRALQAAEDELAAFERRHVVELIAERAARKLATRDRFVAALVELAAAEAAWEEEISEDSRLGQRTGAFTAEEFPDSPLSLDVRAAVSAAADVARRAPDRLLPMPAALAAQLAQAAA